MMLATDRLGETAARLRSNEWDLATYVGECCNRVDALDSTLQAMLGEPNRRERLLAEVRALQARFPDPSGRPPLYGVPVGVKDIFRVDGFMTQAGSELPAEVLAGPEATCVTALRRAGVLVLGKTVTAEFAYLSPGPTRNPHNPDHTPGGSSSGSAAAVAAGFCPVALGTQTVGSVIRPAAFCGIVGFKPTFGRIDPAGLIFCAPSLDTVGLFAQDVQGMALAASLVCEAWKTATHDELPVLGVPEGPYLEQASSEGLRGFAEQLARLEAAGVVVRLVPALHDIAAINERHSRLVLGEMARSHAAWFAEYAALYRPLTAAAIREGQAIGDAELDTARAGRAELRGMLEQLSERAGIDLWVCPAAPGPAPEGIGSTGNSVMNLPWTHAGLPALTLPAGHAANGLPLGLQLAAGFGADEHLLAWAARLEGRLRTDGTTEAQRPRER